MATYLPWDVVLVRPVVGALVAPPIFLPLDVSSKLPLGLDYALERKEFEIKNDAQQFVR
jgi:hypothetical protein